MTRNSLESVRRRLERVRTRRSPGSATDDTDGPDVSLDVVFEVMKNTRRRRILLYLRDAEGTADIRELSRVLAARENDCSTEAVTSTQRKRTYVALYQTHLPKLDDLGVIEYDRRGGRVDLTDHGTAVLTFTEDSADSPRGAYYGGLGAATTALFTLNYLALLPVQVAANVFSSVVILLLVCLSVLQRPH